MQKLKRQDNIADDAFHAHIEKYIGVADAITLLMGPYIEVVIHDLATEKVAYITNAFSQRQVGDDSLMHETDFLATDDVIGPYEKINWDGRRIKAVSCVLRDAKQHPFAVLCINFDTSQFSAAEMVLKSLTQITDVIDKPEALFKEDWYERINEFVHHWAKERNLYLDKLDKNEKKQLVLDLHASGAFNAKNSVTYAARIIGIARATIYNYLKQGKNK